MYYVYLLHSLECPSERYIGYTTDLQTRVKSHNAGQSLHTAKYKPWKLVSYHAFETNKQAKAFEAYLKSGSGRAFAKRHLWH